MSDNNWSNTPNNSSNNGNNFFVDNNSTHEEDDDNKGGCGSWLIYIGILLFINLLSWIFDWSFWVY